jgi:hypothetical protein
MLHNLGFIDLGGVPVDAEGPMAGWPGRLLAGLGCFGSLCVIVWLGGAPSGVERGSKRGRVGVQAGPNHGPRGFHPTDVHNVCLPQSQHDVTL